MAGQLCWGSAQFGERTLRSELWVIMADGDFAWVVDSCRSARGPQTATVLALIAQGHDPLSALRYIIPSHNTTGFHSAKIDPGSVPYGSSLRPYDL